MQPKDRGTFVPEEKFTMKVTVGASMLMGHQFHKDHIKSYEEAERVFEEVYDHAVTIDTKQYYKNHTTGRGIWMSVIALCK